MWDSGRPPNYNYNIVQLGQIENSATSEESYEDPSRFSREWRCFLKGDFGALVPHMFAATGVTQLSGESDRERMSSLLELRFAEIWDDKKDNPIPSWAGDARFLLSGQRPGMSPMWGRQGFCVLAC